MLHRFDVESDLVHREQIAGEPSRRSLVEALTAKQHAALLEPRIRELHAADLAYVLAGLPPEQRALLWPLVQESVAGEVLLELADPLREALLGAMSFEAQVRVMQALDTDELAELAPVLAPGVVEKIRQGLTIEEREQLRAAMSYSPDSVGARMDFEMVTIRDDVTLEVVLRYLRRFDALPDHTDQIFVVDRKDVLKGVLSIGALLVHEPEQKVSEVMRNDPFTLQAIDLAIDAAQAFQRYDLVSAPVIDEAGRLIGRLTVSEAVDVIREDIDSEVLAQAGLREEEDIFSPVWASARNRWLWLGVNLGTAFFASSVIGVFEGVIERVVALAALMPIVAGIAGNSGNQTMTLFIRSLALGQVTPDTIRRLFLKELSIALLNGAVWGSIAGVFAWLLYLGSAQAPLLGLTMMLAIVLNLLIASIIALAVPLTLRQMGRDPALGSSVLLTFTTDSMGFFLFLGLATMLF
ncbi:MAG: magnesium transporter [Betaproteobacteria bacterium]|nr:magnesium transporter [Betaproteobacteria bacterium]